MEAFVARQPILDTNQKVYAYELLYRGNLENLFPNIDGDQATSDVIINSFLNIGIDQLSEGNPCFVNFTENLLKLQLPSYFPPSSLVVEVLENVKPSEEIIEILRELKSLGYKIALDDYTLDQNNLLSFKMLAYADIIKVDVLNTPLEKQKKLLQLLKDMNVDLLAEKVETKEEYEKCKSEGYKYFQGYFFSKPEILSTYDIPVYSSINFQIVEELSQTEPNIDSITEIITRDISLSYKLLKLINSPTFRPINKIKSIKQAIVLLGLNEIRKWIYVITVRESISKNPNVPYEVLKTCFTRAKMCELLISNKQNNKLSSSFFLTGLFSLIDCFLNRPLDEIVNSLSLDQEIIDALLGKQNDYRDVLDLVISIERANWDEIDPLCKKIGIEQARCLDSLKSSIQWTKQLLEEDYRLESNSVT